MSDDNNTPENNDQGPKKGEGRNLEKDARKAAGSLLGGAKKLFDKAADTAKKNPTAAGAATGFLAGGPLGALVGAALGNDKAREKIKKAASEAIDAAKGAAEGTEDLETLKERFGRVKGHDGTKDLSDDRANSQDGVMDGDCEDFTDDADAPEAPRGGNNGPRP